MRTVNFRVRLVPLMAITMFLMIGGLGYQAMAIRSLQNNMLPPAVIATLDLEKTFNECAMRGSITMDIERLAGELQADLDRRRKQIEILQKDLEAFPENSGAYKKAEAELLNLTFQLQALTQVAQQKLETARAKGQKSVYDAIKQTSAELAAENGWDVVIVNDSITAFNAGTEAEMTRQISARRFLYSSNAFDVSDIVIARLNR